jgi:hypothetical protein
VEAPCSTVSNDNRNGKGDDLSMVLSPPQTVLKGLCIVTEKWESKLHSLSAVDHFPLRSARGAEGGQGEGQALRAALPPGPSPALRERGDLGRGRRLVRRHPPPSSPAAWERKGAGGKVRAALTLGPAPALRRRGELGRGRRLVRRHPPPSSPAAWERKRAGGKVRAARHALQYSY